MSETIGSDWIGQRGRSIGPGGGSSSGFELCIIREGNSVNYASVLISWKNDQSVSIDNAEKKRKASNGSSPNASTHPHHNANPLSRGDPSPLESIIARDSMIKLVPHHIPIHAILSLSTPNSPPPEQQERLTAGYKHCPVSRGPETPALPPHYHFHSHASLLPRNLVSQRAGPSVTPWPSRVIHP